MNQLDKVFKDALPGKALTAVALADMLETFLFFTPEGAAYLEEKGWKPPICDCGGPCDCAEKISQKTKEELG